MEETVAALQAQFDSMSTINPLRLLPGQQLEEAKAGLASVTAGWCSNENGNISRHREGTSSRSGATRGVGANEAA
jgi:hypothetical protein